MGYINKDELSNELLEYMEGLGLTEDQVNQIINTLREEELGNVGNLQTEAKDLVGAINELFQSANNGKELIANAIGEPVSKDDTFQAMSNDINGLLSTFKANMMNNGVTVEANDKFKNLIDKIATLADSEGKGIQFASGVTENVYGSQVNDPSNLSINVPINLDFEPTYFLICIPKIQGRMGWASYTNLLLSNFANSQTQNAHGGGGTHTLKVTMSNITTSNFLLTIYSSASGSTYGAAAEINCQITWYAIGVGEEDTTLLDSLKSILAEEGVTTTEEDDMASLISKVDNEFNDKTNEISSLNTNITLLTNQVNSLTNELAGKVTPAGTAVAANVLTGKTFINSTGSTLTGTMANNGTKTITPKASAQTLGAGYYDKITINGDADLVAANIVSGKNIFGVTGTATVSSLGGKSITTGTATGTIYMYTGSNTYTYTLTFNNALTFTPSRFLLYIPKNANSSSPDSISLHNLVVDSVFHKTKEAYGYTCGICITNVTKTDVTITVRMINVNSRHTVTPTWSFIAIS